MASHIELSDRAQHLFKCLVERHIADGQPVGSRTLARDTKLELSPATIRNVMADLEDAGLITSPHTSAGRVPTASGYRLFVDSLVTYKEPESADIRRLSDSFKREPDMRQLMENTSMLLSEVTRLAGLVMIPKTDHRTLRHVEFLPLSDNRVLVILVVNEVEVQNRVIQTARRYSPAELTQAANYLNSAFRGKDIKTVQGDLLREMSETRAAMDRMMEAVIEMTQKAFVDDCREQDYVLAGQTNLMDIEELSDIEKLRHLFDAFTHKRDILHLLDQALSVTGVQIYIGEESGYQALGDCSVVTSTYGDGGQILGVLGVIGPKRMAYERVIPIVDLTAKMLSSALNSMH